MIFSIAAKVRRRKNSGDRSKNIEVRRQEIEVGS